MKGSFATIASLALAVGVVTASPAGASSQRMQLHCDSGTLDGHVLERTNGSSWWDVSDAAVYTTRSITVTADGSVAYDKRYGQKSGEVDTCTGTHFDSTWNLELAGANR